MNKDAVTRARDLLSRLPRWPWTPEHRGIADADGNTIIADVGHNEDLQEFVATAPKLVEQLWGEILSDMIPTDPGVFWFRSAQTQRWSAVTVFWSGSLLGVDWPGRDFPYLVKNMHGEWRGPIVEPVE